MIQHNNKSAIHFLAPPIVVCLLYVSSTVIPFMTGFWFSIFLLVLAIMLFPAFSFGIAERQIKKLIVLQDSGFIKTFLKGDLLRTVFSIVLSIISAVWLALVLIEITQITWVIIGITSIFFEFVRRGMIRKISMQEYKYPFSSLRSTRWTKVCLSLLVTVLSIYYIDPSAVSIPEQVKSNSLKELLHIVELSSIDDFLVNHFLDSSNIPLKMVGLFLLIIKHFPGVYLIFSMFDVAVYPKSILLKSIFPIKYFEHETVPTGNHLAWPIAIFIFFIMLIWLPGSAKLEFLAGENPVISKLSKRLIEKVEEELVEAELINGNYYEPGTIDQVESIEAQLQIEYDDSALRAQLRNEVEASFLKLEQNADIFLDHYYSLEAEYVRIAKMFTGELENYLRTQLDEALLTEDPFQAVNSLVFREARLRDQYLVDKQAQIDTLDELLSANKMIIETNQEADVIRSKQSPILDLDMPSLKATLEETSAIRWNISAASGVIVGLVVKNVVAKGTIKTLATALTKVVGKKVAAITTGAAIGGVIGSIVPGAGTVLLAASGSVVGALAVEWGSLKIDEMINREEFKDQIISEIQREKRKILKDL